MKDLPLTTAYRRIDPDGIKVLLLSRLEQAGLLSARHDVILDDGKPVAVAELSGWVHRASTDIADQVRRYCLDRGENFVMEGTLSWEPLAGIYGRELEEAGFCDLRVFDVEVPRNVAMEQARQRWWEGRCSMVGPGGAQAQRCGRVEPRSFRAGRKRGVNRVCVGW